MGTEPLSQFSCISLSILALTRTIWNTYQTHVLLLLNFNTFIENPRSPTVVTVRSIQVNNISSVVFHFNFKIESIFSLRSPSLKVFGWYREKWFSKMNFEFGINWISVYRLETKVWLLVQRGIKYLG